MEFLPSRAHPDLYHREALPADYFISSQYDPMPYHQLFDIQCKLNAVGVDSSMYQVLTILNSSEHAFQYWRSADGTGSALTNGTRVINFLNSHLK
jgi:hypothetical protein